MHLDLILEFTLRTLMEHNQVTCRESKIPLHISGRNTMPKLPLDITCASVNRVVNVSLRSTKRDARTHSTISDKFATAYRAAAAISHCDMIIHSIC